MARRLCTAGLAGLASLGLAACAEMQTGESGMQAELNRLKGRNGFAVVASAPNRTVFAAKGARVVIAPTSGFCVAEDSLDISGTAAFALLSDCAVRSASASAPPIFPGILTVSVSGNPMVEPGSTADETLDGLERFVGTPGGAGLLGRGRAGSVSVVETVRLGDGLYVLVEDPGGEPLPVLSSRFWRAFVELAGRMSMVTVSGFRGAPTEDEQMLAFLVKQVVALKEANARAPSAGERQMAGRVDDRYTGAAASAGVAPFDPEGTGDASPAPQKKPGDAVATLSDAPATGEQRYGGLVTSESGPKTIYRGPGTAPETIYRGPGAAGDGGATPPDAEGEVAGTPPTESRAAASDPVYAGPTAATPTAAPYRGPVATPEPAKAREATEASDAAYRGPGAADAPYAGPEADRQ